MAVRRILENPPPLTPARLRNFPYEVRPFPFRTLADFAALTRWRGKPAAQSVTETNANRIE